MMETWKHCGFCGSGILIITSGMVSGMVTLACHRGHPVVLPPGHRMEIEVSE